MNFAEPIKNNNNILFIILLLIIFLVLVIIIYFNSMTQNNESPGTWKERMGRRIDPAFSILWSFRIVPCSTPESNQFLITL
jgi:hypothetical protein